MSQGERTGHRDLTYSRWHRVNNIARVLGSTVRASKLTLIDIDGCEACCYCSTPLALIETERSYNHPKTAKITALLAGMAGIPAYSVAYWTAEDSTTIDHFVVRQIQPENPWNWFMWPDDYAAFLESLRTGHNCRQATGGQPCGAD